MLWGSVVVFALLSAAAGTRTLHSLDTRALQLAQTRTSAVFDAVGGVFSVLGEVQYTAAAALALAAVLVFGGRRTLGVRFLAAFVATGIVEVAMKFLLPQAPMPEQTARSTDLTPIVEVDLPYPYPSGHMLRAVLLLGMVYMLWPNRLVRTAVVILLAAMAVTRVYLGVHWASDVLGGGLLGVIGLAWAYRQKEDS